MKWSLALGGVNEVNGASCQGSALPTCWSSGQGALALHLPARGWRRGKVRDKRVEWCWSLAYIYITELWVRTMFVGFPRDIGEEVLLLEVQCEIKGMMYIFFLINLFFEWGQQGGRGSLCFQVSSLASEQFCSAWSWMTLQEGTGVGAGWVRSPVPCLRNCWYCPATGKSPD